MVVVDAVVDAVVDVEVDVVVDGVSGRKIKMSRLLSCLSMMLSCLLMMLSRLSSSRRKRSSKLVAWCLALYGLYGYIVP